MVGIENIINDFFSKLGIEIKNVSVKEEEQNIFSVRIETDESSIVIGPYGRNLDLIKNILKLILSRNLEQNIILHLEVNDYLKLKEDRLINFVKKKIDFLKKFEKDIKMPFLSAYERKKVHSFISELWDRTIFTKSVWEWAERRLIICKQWEKLNLDIDWDDI